MDLVKLGIYVAVAAALAGVATLAWQRVDGWCNEACRDAKAAHASDKATWTAKELEREAALVEREKQHADEKQRLREGEAIADASTKSAEIHMRRAMERAAGLAAELKAALASCSLPGAARRVFDDAARGLPAGDRPEARLRPPAPGPAAAPGAPAGGAVAQDDLAPRAGDAAPVECVTAWEVGVRNTARAAFNADELDKCEMKRIRLWESCTGKTYPWRELAPWLTKEATP